MAVATPGFWRNLASALWRHRPLLLLLGLMGVVSGLYWPTLDDPFHGDDFVAFTDLGNKPPLKYLEDVFLFKDANFYWRPLGSTFHFLLYEIGGLDPTLFRVGGLLFFLATLVALYFFCLREGMGEKVALGAVAIFGLLPNHVVSVAWVTNTSRLQAVFFVLCTLLLLQRRTHRRWWQEALALLFFIAAILSDETAMSLAPVPVLYAAFIAAQRFDWRTAVPRLVAYALPVVALMPLQFQNTLNDEPRLATYGFGPHIPTQAWALISQLVLPLTSAAPVDIFLYRIPPEQWAAGAVATVLGVALFVFGSNQLRFLLIWTGLSLAPFTLWGVSYTSPRYVYMAAPPYAIILAWTLVSLTSLRLPEKLFAPRARRFAGALAVAAAVCTVAIVSSAAVLSRNEKWSIETAKYGLLRENLEATLPSVPRGSRIVIYYGGWYDFWATSVAQGVYQDRSIRVLNVKRDRVDAGGPPRRANDVVVYFVDNRFVTISPPASTSARTSP